MPAPVADLILSARAVVEQALLEELQDRPILENGSVLERYLALSLAHQPVEQVRLLLLDARLQLIADEPLATGSAAEVPIYAREVARRCLDLGATGLILVHNHPSGQAQPGADDIAATRRLAETLRGLEIELWDHVVVAAGGSTSMRVAGLL